MLPYYLIIMILCTGRQNIPVLSSPPLRTSLIYVRVPSYIPVLALTILVPHAKFQSPI